MGELGGSDRLAGALVLEDFVDGFPVLFAVGTEVVVLDAEADKVGAGHLEAVVFINEALFVGVGQLGGIGFLLGNFRRWGGVAQVYSPEVVDVFRDTGEGGENREDDQEDYLPGARQEGAADFVVEPDE